MAETATDSAAPIMIDAVTAPTVEVAMETEYAFYYFFYKNY